MFDQVIFLLVGLTLLLVSVDRMIEYSDRIAKYFQISPILIGLTLVAFGTSAPELVITLFASFNNPPNTDAIIGNVIGSNIANILLILVFSGLFFKLDFGKISIKEILFLGIATIYFSVAFFIIEVANFIYISGFVLLAILFLNYLRTYPNTSENSNGLVFSKAIYLYLALSFIGIFFGGKVFLSQALLIFTEVGLSGSGVAVSANLTVLAIGTSLPELITVLISYFKRKGDIGIGNIVGSNIMNILFVFMPSLIIVHLRNFEYHLSSINDANILNNDESIIILVFATLIFIALSFMKIKLSKWMAIILLFCYFSYIFRILL